MLQASPGGMDVLCRCIARPWHRLMGYLCQWIPFSVAEFVYAAGGVFLLVYCAAQVWAIVRRPQKLRRLYRLTASLVCFALVLAAGVSFLWTVYYESSDTEAVFGLAAEPVSMQELYEAACYFAALANDYAEKTDRDEQEVFLADVNKLLENSASIYDNISVQYPALQGPALRAKAMLFSEFMSRINFTGFFFAFTGEANVNTAAPLCLLPSTIAHELAHQRGVAREDEANFTAVMAGLASGDADYCYSVSLLALIHLGNAVYSADRELYEQLRQTYGEKVLADLRENSRYWSQYETKAAEISGDVYGRFLETQGDERGVASYGACVDLLVAYHKQIQET